MYSGFRFNSFSKLSCFASYRLGFSFARYCTLFSNFSDKNSRYHFHRLVDPVFVIYRINGESRYDRKGWLIARERLEKAELSSTFCSSRMKDIRQTFGMKLGEKNLIVIYILRNIPCFHEELTTLT